VIGRKGRSHPLDQSHQGKSLIVTETNLVTNVGLSLNVIAVQRIPVPIAEIRRIRHGFFQVSTAAPHPHRHGELTAGLERRPHILAHLPDVLFPHKLQAPLPGFATTSTTLQTLVCSLQRHPITCAAHVIDV